MTELIKVTTDGFIERIPHVGPFDDPRKMAGLIGCQWVEVVPVSAELDLWADEEGLITQQPLNEVVSRFAGGPLAGNIVLATRDGEHVVGLGQSANDELVAMLKTLGGKEKVSES